MRLFKVFHYKRKSKERLRHLFQRVLAATGEPGQGCRGVLFLFKDNPRGKVSAAARLIKAYPETAAFHYDGPVDEQNKGRPPYAVVGNFGPPWMEHNPNKATGTLPITTLVDILDGIPRRFPFRRAAITIDGVDWNDDGGLLAEQAAPDNHPPAPGFGRYLFPCVMLNDDSHIFPQAVVELSPAHPHVSAAAKAKLDMIGRIAAETTRARYDGAERERLLEQRDRANAFVERFKTDLGFWLRSRVALPAQLPAKETAGTDKPFSLKQVLGATFGPLGYRKLPRMSDQSVTVMEKRIPSNHRLELFVDRGTWSRVLTCTFAFHGIEKTHSFDLPAHPDQRGQSYPADGQEVVDAVVANWGAIARALENDFVPELVKIYGADPDWA